MTWSMGDKMQGVMMEFKNWCGMQNVMNAIDNTHIAIMKPFNAIAKDYYYHKTINYNIVTQVVANNYKTFTNVYVGLFRSVNGCHVLKKSWLC